MVIERQSELAEPRQAAAPRPLLQTELEPVWLLGGVSVESVFGLLVHCEVIEREAGVVLISPERDERNMYLVLSGCLDVYLEAERHEAVARIPVGQSVGELAVIDARRASAYVVTAERARLLVIDEGTFWRLVAASHPFAINLLVLLAQRMRANNQQLSASVQRSRMLEREAITDALTGLYNRRWLDQRLPRLVTRHERAARPLSLMLLDIDHFKRFNDDFGHATGDLVLSTVARVVSSQVRPTDLAVRYGGEEIVVVLPDTPLEGARVAAERLRRAIAAARTPELERPITVSIGIAMLSYGEEALGLLERADQKLYLAKAHGRDRVEG